MNNCIYFNVKIFWFLINGKNIPFEDKSGSIRHNCPKFKKAKISLNQRVIDLEEKVEGLKNLTSKILAKIDTLEKQGE